MIIRDALDSDLPAIIDIYNATVPTRMVTAELEPTTVEARLPWFREHSPDEHPFWVAESDGRVIGWLDFKKFLPRCAYRGTAEISVYVDEKFRRRGVAHRLLEESIARSPSLGITAIVGLIFGHNQPSLKLFERLGFQRWGLLPGIARLDGLERDLVVMGRHCPARATRPALQASGFAGNDSQFNECRRDRRVPWRGDHRRSVRRARFWEAKNAHRDRTRWKPETQTTRYAQYFARLGTKSRQATRVRNGYSHQSALF